MSKSNYPIEKGIDVPELRGYHRYPFQDMEIGDSFFIPKMKIAQVGTLVARAKRAYNMNFMSRTVEGGVRTWRIPNKGD